MRSFMVVLVVAACDAGAKPTPPVQHEQVQHEQVLLASIQRGPCMGDCPAYSLRVYRDGKVEYEGKGSVKTKGTAEGKLTDAQLAALDKLFTDGHYLAYKNEYEHMDATDAPRARTAYLSIGARTPKTVSHYYGDLHAPQSLTELETKFDEIVQIERWIGTPAERSSRSN